MRKLGEFLTSLLRGSLKDVVQILRPNSRGHDGPLGLGTFQLLLDVWIGKQLSELGTKTLLYDVERARSVLLEGVPGVIARRLSSDLHRAFSGENWSTADQFCTSYCQVRAKAFIGNIEV